MDEREKKSIVQKFWCSRLLALAFFTQIGHGAFWFNDAVAFL
jgi:hypothetical protein